VPDRASDSFVGVGTPPLDGTPSAASVALVSRVARVVHHLAMGQDFDKARTLMSSLKSGAIESYVTHEVSFAFPSLRFGGVEPLAFGLIHAVPWLEGIHVAYLRDVRKRLTAVSLVC
jgi:hypothetical protein